MSFHVKNVFASAIPSSDKQVSLKIFSPAKSSCRIILYSVKGCFLHCWFHKYTMKNSKWWNCNFENIGIYFRASDQVRGIKMMYCYSSVSMMLEGNLVQRRPWSVDINLIKRFSPVLNGIFQTNQQKTPELNCDSSKRSVVWSCAFRLAFLSLNIALRWVRHYCWNITKIWTILRQLCCFVETSFDCCTQEILVPLCETS